MAKPMTVEFEWTRTGSSLVLRVGVISGQVGKPILRGAQSRNYLATLPDPAEIRVAMC